MKTTVDIPEKELRDAMRFTKAKTKREAIVTALEEYNRLHRMAALTRHFGTFTSLLSNDEIEAMDEVGLQDLAKDESQIQLAER